MINFVRQFDHIRTVNYIIIIGATQALLALGILFKNRKNNGRHDTILSYLLAAIFLHLMLSFMLNIFWSESKIHRQFNTFIALAYPGLLWCYMLYLEDRGKLVNILFAMFPAICASIGYFAVAAYVIGNSGELPSYIQTYNSFSSYAYTLLYCVYPIKILCNISQISTFWKLERQMLRMAATLFFLIGLSFLVLICYQKLADISPYFTFIHLALRIFIYSILTIISLSIIYVKISSFLYIHADQGGLSQENLLADYEPDKLLKGKLIGQGSEDEVVGIKLIDEEKRKHASIDYADILNKLENLMENQKVFIDPDLTLEVLASKVNVSRHHLSETLNQYRQKSFYHYINEHRIREVVTLMDANKISGQHVNILSLAFQAGFNSKSSFNQYFKKVVGCTPSNYLKAKPQYIFSSAKQL